MKKFLFLKLLVLVACLSSALSATAYDFYVASNGQYIYYYIMSDNTVGVTYRVGYGTYTGNVTIPSTVTYSGTTYTVTAILHDAFYGNTNNGTYITGISIPSTVTRIDEHAFTNQRNLSSITLPSNLQQLKALAFSGCSSLTSITIPNSVTTIADRLFEDCSSLTSVSMGNNVTTIEYGAFRNTGLTEFVVPDKVTTIEANAFQNCGSLTKFTIGKSVTSIGEYALAFNGTTTMYGQTALRAVDIYSNAVTPPTIQSNTFGTYDSSNTLTNPYKRYTVYVHGPYEQSLYAAATYWSNFITTSTTNIRTLQNYDFYTGGIYYNISGSNTAMVVNKYGYNSISWYGLGDYSYRGDVTIPNTAYDSYTGKTYNVTAIGASAFCETPIMMLNNPAEAPSLRDQGDLKSVTIGNNVTTIEQEAFKDCSGLTTVSLGTGVTSIGNYAFNGCSALTSVFSRRATPPTITSSTFDNSHYSRATVYVPTAAAVSSYKAANYWRNFTNIKVIPTLNEALNVPGGNISFTSTGSYPWMVMDDGVGLYAKSGNGGVHSSSSMLTATVNVPTGGAPLTFDFKAWGEGTSYDKCVFSVDGAEQFSYGARDNGWETYTVQLTAGTHTLTWNYTKDGSVNPEGDFFAVRNVKLNVEAYAYWSQMLPNFLTFYYDGLRSARTGIHPNGFLQVTFDLNEGTNIPAWINFAYAGNINYVAFDATFANARPTSTYQWFAGMPIQYISGISNLNTENVTNMAYMFYACIGLTNNLDVSNFNTANVTDMSYMFAQCANLTSLDVSSFNTSKVTNMSYMFYYCQNLTDLDVSSFNTSKVTNMDAMFANCSNLTNIDLSNFNTAKVTNMTGMFGNCSKLTTIYAGSGWTTNAVTSSGNMFANCTKLVGGKGTTYNSSHLDKAYAHIDGGPSNPGYFTDINASQAGDVNGDGSVTIADVTALIDSLLSGVEVPLDAADVNGDGQVTIADVTELIDRLLSGN